MSMLPIQVTTEHYLTQYQDPYDIFLTLRNHFGAEKVYLLESLAGPKRDQKTSSVGFLSLLTLEIKRQQIKIHGHPVLANALSNSLIQTQLVTSDDQNTLRLINNFVLWDLLRHIQQQFKINSEEENHYFSCGFFGYLGYDTAWYCEELPYLITARDDVPDVVLVFYQGIINCDLTTKKITIHINQAPHVWKSVDSQFIKQLLSEPKLEMPPILSNNLPTPIKIIDSTTRAQFIQKVDQALQYIKSGDIYQIQLGHELMIDSLIDPMTVYARLRKRNPSPYMYAAAFNKFTIIGASPELFLHICNDQVVLRPIAGTSKRGNNEQADQLAIAQLKSNQKEIAEHIMLVDLCRNDIGRVCQPNTLNVEQLMIIEQYSHVFHMVSHVTGKRLVNKDHFDIIAATFPEGTISGAPKIRAMEIIEELETKRRGVYAGAIGHIGFNGYVNLALCIRSAVHHQHSYSIRACAGIVADSVAELEWQETIAKLGACFWAITNQEIHDYEHPSN